MQTTVLKIMLVSRLDYIMISSCGSRTLALLTSGYICSWDDSGAEVCPKVESIGRLTNPCGSNQGPEEIGADTVLELIICPMSGTRIIVTRSGRIYVGLFSGGVMRDITTVVCETLGKGIDDVTEICIDRFTIIARIEDSIGIINMQTVGNVANCDIAGFSSSLHTFTSPVNLISYRFNRGYIRTDDGLLYFISDIPGSTSSEPQVVNIVDAARIHEIICCSHHTLFHMKDGTVRVQSLERENDMYACEFFGHVKFPEGVRIAKVVVNSIQVFYITTEGRCYYTDGGSEVILLRALEGYFVENMFSVSDHMAVLHDGNRVCLLRMIPVIREFPQYITYVIRDRIEIDPAHRDGSAQPINLSFFDDKSIVAVIQAQNRTYFTADDGSVYYGTINTHTIEPTIKRILFFDANPVATKNSVMRIRSAANAIKPSA